MTSTFGASFGAFFTGLVLIVVLVTKFTHGAWVALLGMVIFYATMTAIRKHYDRVAAEIAAPEGPSDDVVRPSRVHSVVLISRIHRPTLRALAYAKLMRSHTLEALSVNVDPVETKALQEEWTRRGIDVPLKVLDSPYREVTRPVIEYVKGLRKESPRDAVSVIIPEYVVGHWYEHLLHNQSALRLKGRLLFTPGVMVTSVPYQLESSEVAKRRDAIKLPLAGGVAQRKCLECHDDDNSPEFHHRGAFEEYWKQVEHVGKD